jgi:hypothetical protein
LAANKDPLFKTKIKQSWHERISRQRSSAALANPRESLASMERDEIKENSQFKI